MQFGRLWRPFIWLTGLLSGDPSRDHCNNGRQDNFSHDQSPVVFESYMISNVRALHQAGMPAPDDYLKVWPVSRRVNKSRAASDDPTLIDRAAA